MTATKSRCMHENFNFKGVKSCGVMSQTVKIKLKIKFHMYSDPNNFFLLQLSHFFLTENTSLS